MVRHLVLAAALVGCAADGGAIDDMPTGDGGRTESGTTDSAFSYDSTPSSTDSGSGTTEGGSIFETEGPCDPGLTSCTTGCADLSKDSSNCGACGKACASGEACNAGKCEIVCASPTTKCGTSCVNTSSDTSNCGACGKACASGEVCKSGTCEIVCSSPTTKCGTACVNTSSDTSNCGACGRACASGEACTGGSCIPPIVTTNVTFPSSTSTLSSSSSYCSGALGAGGGARCYIAGDAISETFSRSASATKLTVSFRMSDYTSSYCYVGTLTWSVLVNGVVVGSFSWTGGFGGDKTISQTYSFAPIAASGGSFTLRYQANNTVCPGGGSWNYYSGGTATLQ
jgi:hypothetical protein